MRNALAIMFFLLASTSGATTVVKVINVADSIEHDYRGNPIVLLPIEFEPNELGGGDPVRSNGTICGANWGRNAWRSD
jgi:hypothetical protein